ncbi:MAG: hypothetical protein R2788_02925 [Saprospiraceae bacterium]
MVIFLTTCLRPCLAKKPGYSTIEVFVPMNVAFGIGNIKFITFNGEEFFSPAINIKA